MCCIDIPDGRSDGSLAITASGHAAKIRSKVLDISSSLAAFIRCSSSFK
jgi:hypothetical protein